MPWRERRSVRWCVLYGLKTDGRSNDKLALRIFHSDIVSVCPSTNQWFGASQNLNTNYSDIQFFSEDWMIPILFLFVKTWWFQYFYFWRLNDFNFFFSEDSMVSILELRFVVSVTCQPHRQTGVSESFVGLMPACTEAITLACSVVHLHKFSLNICCCLFSCLTVEQKTRECFAVHCQKSTQLLFTHQSRWQTLSISR